MPGPLRRQDRSPPPGIAPHRGLRTSTGRLSPRVRRQSASARRREARRQPLPCSSGRLPLGMRGGNPGPSPARPRAVLPEAARAVPFRLRRGRDRSLRHCGARVALRVQADFLFRGMRLHRNAVVPADCGRSYGSSPQRQLPEAIGALQPRVWAVRHRSRRGTPCADGMRNAAPSMPARVWSEFARSRPQVSLHGL